MHWSSYWTVDLAWWQGLWYTFLVWVISHWQPRCSLIRAAVTGACITNLSKRLSTHPSAFRWKSTPRSYHTYIYMLRDTLTRRAFRRTCAHTNTTHIQTSFPLWWQILPELASICDSWRGVLYESNSSRHLPFTDGSAGCPKPLSGGHDCRTVLFSNLPWSGWRRDT